MKIIIKNISQIIQTERKNISFLYGKNMRNLNVINDGFIEISNGIITNYGNMSNWSGIDDWNNIKIIDAEGGSVFPSYCDSHTHLVFAETREKEFVDRIKGLSYQEIAELGGGILNSARKLEKLSEEELYKKAKKNINKIIESGTGAVEIKSGYGLSTDSELKILRVIKKLKQTSEITIKSTFLGAHAIPKKYESNRTQYLNLIINEMLPLIAEENLADYIDVFCEKSYFSVEETIKILNAGKKYKLQAKTHVNQFNALGGVKASVDSGALSVDHLEILTKDDIISLTESKCMPTALPSCSFFLGLPYSPVRELINNNLPVAIASDYNPGSSPSGNMNFILSLACIKLKMTPEEAINAATINSAYAMGVEKELGSIDIGKRANLFITKKIPGYSYLPYSFGENLIKTKILNGKVQQ
tara:strand:+ start:11040 stop:12287 length:1248 start_codon:yes stop_codon:yes gene_type:complete